MDLEYLRTRLTNLRDEELWRELLFQGEGMRPEARAALEDELRVRGRPWAEVIAEAEYETGRTVGRIEEVRRFVRSASTQGAPPAGPAKGVILLTTRGLGFLATHFEHKFNLAGWLADATTGLPVSSKMRGEPLEARFWTYPLSLLSRLHSETSWLGLGDLQSLSLAKGRLMIQDFSGTTARAEIPPEGDFALHRWADAVNVTVEDVQGRLEPGESPEKRVGIWRRIFR